MSTPDRGEETSNTKVYTSCEQNNDSIGGFITEDFNTVAILNDMSTCASCGKEGNSDDMNICKKCKSTRYCNAACKKKHRTKHKKKCDRHVAELYDEQLFKEVEPEECPICMLSMPFGTYTSSFKTCCGKRICYGCDYAMKMSEGKDLCAFCRTPPPGSEEEELKCVKNLMDKENGLAFHFMAGLCDQGIYGLTQDRAKASELWLKAGELGCAAANFNLGHQYYRGEGVEVDKKKAKYYWELAAMNGSAQARNNLGYLEREAGNHHRALKHRTLAARAGYKKSLDIVKECFMQGDVTKEEYANTLRAYQKAQDEMKSDERDRAASTSEMQD